MLRTALGLGSGLLQPLYGCASRPLGGRTYFFSGQTAARSAFTHEQGAAIDGVFGNMAELDPQLRAGDAVVFPDRHYALSAPLSLVDGVTYRARAGTAPVLDARGQLDFCISGRASRDVHLEGLTCINARLNGIDVRADPDTGRLPYNVTIRRCAASRNGSSSGKLLHEEGNGIAIHTGIGFRARLEPTTSGIVVEDCETHANQHAGILIDLPGEGHRISRCRAGGNGLASGTNSWAILIRPPGGAKAQGWTRRGAIWHGTAPRFRHQLPTQFICTRLRRAGQARWSELAWDLRRTRGDQSRPGAGEFGFVADADRQVPQLFLNLGDVRDFRIVLGWIGDCRDPLIEGCEAWQQGGSDGVGIGFDQNTFDGLIRNCTSHDNRRGFSLHIARGGMLRDNIAYGNREFGLKIDRNLGEFALVNNIAYENGLADFHFAAMAPDAWELIGNRAYSATGYEAIGADISRGLAGNKANFYCGAGRDTVGFAGLEVVRSGCVER